MDIKTRSSNWRSRPSNNSHTAEKQERTDVLSSYSSSCDRSCSPPKETRKFLRCRLLYSLRTHALIYLPFHRGQQLWPGPTHLLTSGHNLAGEGDHRRPKLQWKDSLWLVQKKALYIFFFFLIISNYSWPPRCYSAFSPSPLLGQIQEK